MSEPDSPTRRGELHHHHQQQQLHQSVDERDEANNSIIGKVRSRVSSIFPQQLTKWFSPAAASAVTSNGGVGGASRRRRRNEDDDDDHEHNSHGDNDSEASDHSGGEDADEYSSPASAQPPSKRSRLNIEETRTNFRNSESLFSSTPTLKGRQGLLGKRKEPAYNFGGNLKLSTTTSTTTNTLRSVVTTSTPSVGSADIIEVVPERNVLNTSLSSRRSLNIPSSSSANESHRLQNDFKRRSMMSVRTPTAVGTAYQMPKSITTISIAEGNDDDENDANNDDHHDEEPSQGLTQTINVRDEDLVDVDEDDVEDEDENDESEEIAKAISSSKKPTTFTNGNRIGRSSSIATESGESRSSSVAQQTAQPTIVAKPGLFNQANRSLRTMSGNGLNFYSHLEGRKSLFSEKNMPGMLNNSTLSLTSLNRRQFNSSIYGSTSALSDSRLLNTSSPFYKGQTTYGGAAAYSKFNRSLNQSIRIAPTLIRPTSSLSTLSSSTNSLAQGNDQSNSTAISSTAKRILELINDFSTPLNDAKKMASNIKTPGLNRNAATGKRFSDTDLATARSVRLSSVRKPYTRPAVTLNPNNNNNNNNNDSKKLLPPLKELQVPSMSQLLQMKKMQNCTERSRQIANTSKSALNRDCEYKLRFDEQDAAQKQENSDKGKQSSGKIKSKVTTSLRASSKNTPVELEEPPAPVNLPNIAFPFMASVPKIDIAVNSSSGPQKPKTDLRFAASSEAKPTNNFSFGIAAKKPDTVTPEQPKATMNFNFTPNTSAAPSSSNLSSSSSSSTEFKFSTPESVNCTPSKSAVAPINNFKFSSPVMVENKAQEAVVKEKTPAFALPTPPVPKLKTGSVLDALKKQATEKPATPAATPANFGDMFKKPANEWECSACMLRNKETLEKCVACETPRAKPAAAATAAVLPPTNSFPIKNTFGEAFKPKSDTWECSACMVRNKNDANECVACCTKKPGASAAAAPKAAPKLESTDAGFKSLVAQQKASKWECDACMTRNDAERNKCVCCEQAKPGSQVVSDSVPQFSFGTSSASKFTFGFGGAAKKEDELKAAAAAATAPTTTMTNSASSSKTDNKTGFTFGIPAAAAAKTNDTSSSSSISSTGFTFGIKPTQPSAITTTSKDVPDVVKTNTTKGFTFGVPSSSAAESSKSDTTTTTTTTTAAASPLKGFSFGLKPAATVDSASAESNKVNSAVTSTTTTSATSSLFNPPPNQTLSAFGSLKKTDDAKPTETKALQFGITATPAAAIKPITFNAPAAALTQSPATTSEATKTPPKVTFGSFSTASSAVSTSTPSSAFVFGKPAAGTTATTSAFAPKAAAAGFSFGKDQSPSSGSSLFGSVTASKSGDTKPIFGVLSVTPVVSTAAAAATVSSSTTGFGFGKPAATTSLFGAAAATSTSMAAPTTSVFGSKPATTLFSAPAGPATSTTSPSSMPISTITSSGLSTGNASSSTSSSTPSAAPFVFGSGAGAATAAPNANNKPIFGANSFDAASTVGAPTQTPSTTTSRWPTNSFSFGATKPPEETAKTNAPPAFGSTASIFGQPSSAMFGSGQTQQQQQVVGEVKPMTAAVAATPSAIPSFGAPAATSTLFGANASGGLGAPTSSNMFESAPASSNIFGSAAASSTPVFGSAKPSGFEGFGAAATSAPAVPTNSNTTNPAAMPTFGSSSAFSSGFASFSSSGSDGAPAPKKADMAFNFGSAQASTNTGFSFGGGNNNKPASDSVFKFSTTSTPSFNFTGTSESINVAQPFQFGAPTSTPAVFNFGGVEGSNSGGPFQFNAAAPTAATNNIFAPMPTPGLAGSQQAARRKMRTVTRRTQPR